MKRALPALVCLGLLISPAWMGRPAHASTPPDPRFGAVEAYDAPDQATLAGVGWELFTILWYTSLHTHVAPAALSRVIAYDTFGSIVLVPLAEAAAGPLVETLGTSPTLCISVALIVLPTLAVLGVPEVRTLRARR